MAAEAAPARPSCRQPYGSTRPRRGQRRELVGGIDGLLHDLRGPAASAISPLTTTAQAKRWPGGSARPPPTASSTRASAGRPRAGPCGGSRSAPRAGRPRACAPGATASAAKARSAPTPRPSGPTGSASSSGQARPSGLGSLGSTSRAWITPAAPLQAFLKRTLRTSRRSTIGPRPRRAGRGNNGAIRARPSSVRSLGWRFVCRSIAAMRPRVRRVHIQSGNHDQPSRYNPFSNGLSAWRERLVRDQEVACSNHVAPANVRRRAGRQAGAAPQAEARGRRMWSTRAAPTGVSAARWRSGGSWPARGGSIPPATPSTSRAWRNGRARRSWVPAGGGGQALTPAPTSSPGCGGSARWGAPLGRERTQGARPAIQTIFGNSGTRRNRGPKGRAGSGSAIIRRKGDARLQ